MGLRATISSRPMARRSLSGPVPGTDERSRLLAVLGGAWLESDHGACLVAGATYPHEYVHGRIRVADFTSVPDGVLARLCREASLGSVRPHEALFLDTETTGLSLDGTTLVFMVGVGFFDEGGLHVRQFFVHNPAAERAMLLQLRDLLSDFAAVVTYNGKQFDVPMLQRRAGRYQIELGLERLAHADLLYPARRLWKERLGSCRLANLERHLTGFRRTGDVPGSRIPGLYAEYLTSGDASGLVPVFYHNVQDILTLLAVTCVAVRSYVEPLASRDVSGLDLFSLGRTFEADGDLRRALAVYHHALARPLPPHAKESICRRLVSVHRACAVLPDATALWEQLTTSVSIGSVYPLEQLAKHHEHTTGELGRAQELLARALDLLEQDRCTRTSRRELEKRLTRVREKAGAARRP